MEVREEVEQLRRSWIANSSAWCDAVRNDLIDSRREVTNGAIISAVLDGQPRRVLDLGCGEGWLARALHSHGIDVTGVDASEPLIEAARAAGGGTFICATYENLVAEPPFDVIVANFSLLDDRADVVLQTLRPLLSEGGRLIIQTVHPLSAVEDNSYADGWRTETFSALPGTWAQPMPWYFRTLASWHRLLTAAGYAIVEIREPSHADKSRPASIIFLCGRA